MNLNNIKYIKQDDDGFNKRYMFMIDSVRWWYVIMAEIKETRFYNGLDCYILKSILPLNILEPKETLTRFFKLLSLS